MSELIRVKFDGGLAASGQLHFYEYSRSQYAMARFIATIEHFRRTGKVAERITVSSNVDVIVRSPQQGSFIEDLLVPAVQQGMASVISTPLSSLISYAWALLAPRSEKTETAVEQFAKIRLAEVAANVEIERERTKQLQIWQQVASGDRANAAAALDLANWAIQTTNMAVGRLGYTRQELGEMRDELDAERQREEEFSEHRGALEEIEESTVNHLTSRLRPMVSEIALPLRRSAEKMSMSHGETNTTYANLTPSVVAAIANREAEDVVVEITGHVKSYDRDSGVGKVTSNELLRVLNFVVPLRDRSRLRDKILDAMRRERVELLCRRVIDRSGLPTSLILIDINIDLDVTSAGDEDEI